MFDAEIVNRVIEVLRSQRNRFGYNSHTRADADVRGLYAFWLGSGLCLYVGQTTDIKGRMYRHFMQEHSHCLIRYFRAFPQEIEMSYITLDGWSAAKLRRYEQETKRILRAVCNIA